MRSYFNGGGSTASSATPPPSLSGRTRGSTGQMIAARSSSASLPRSPESDIQAMIQAAGGSSGSGQGSLGSHGSTQEVYVNIYQNTNHPSLFVSGFGLFFLHTLTFNTIMGRFLHFFMDISYLIVHLRFHEIFFNCLIMQQILICIGFSMFE